MMTHLAKTVYDKMIPFTHQRQHSLQAMRSTKTGFFQFHFHFMSVASGCAAAH